MLDLPSRQKRCFGDTSATKECVDRAYETQLAEGLRYERRSLHAAFALSDRKEGMRAFVEKRDPAYRNC